jgi:hypothetical protein
MVRIGIEASERIGLACEAEAVAGPAVMSVPPREFVNNNKMRLCTTAFVPQFFPGYRFRPLDSLIRPLRTSSCVANTREEVSYLGVAEVERYPFNTSVSRRLA